VITLPLFTLLFAVLFAILFVFIHAICEAWFLLQKYILIRWPATGPAHCDAMAEPGQGASMYSTGWCAA
jgi:hypothetical protein